MHLLKILLKSKCSVNNMILLLIFSSLLVVLHIYMMNDMTKFVITLSSALKLKSNHQKLETTSKTSAKFILLWQPYYMIDSKEMTWNLKSLNCTVSDCIFTKNRNLLNGDITLFDAILFNEQILNSKSNRPERRSNSQIYIFTTVESSHRFPSCELFDDDFFNLTFTYRLDSDVVFNYFFVKTVNETIIAPNKNIKWSQNKDPVKPMIKQMLSSKKKAAAWLVSNCNADSLRNEYMTNLQENLCHFSRTVDVYGACSKRQCDNNNCNEMIKKDYFFYMAFENSFSEDYVTEKVLHGYNNFAVPIVYGGANYTRFLPPGSYVNAREMHPYNLAHLIDKSMQNKSFYEDFFKWTNQYIINSIEMNKDHPLCNLCQALHDRKMRHAPAKKKFRIWWNGLNGMKWCLSKEYWSEQNKFNIEGNDDFTVY